MFRDLTTYRLEDVTVLRDDNNSFSPPDVQAGFNDSNRTSKPVSPSPTSPSHVDQYGQELQAPTNSARSPRSTSLYMSILASLTTKGFDVVAPR
jgi:hypothetical protein